MADLSFTPIPSDKSIDLYESLVSARHLKLHPALSRAVGEVGVATIDEELRELVPPRALTHVAGSGLRGERVFPVPSILEHTPPLIGYYRMLLGLSKTKDFDQRLGYGPWVRAEDSGVLTPRLRAALPELCKAFIPPLEDLVYAMDRFTDRDLSDLALLTLGPTLQGSRNTRKGSQAAKKRFVSMQTLVCEWITFSSEKLIRFRAPAGHSFALIESSDPDLRLEVTAEDGREIPLVGIEIKGGEDTSNPHNRADEANKSHVKAQEAGYGHRWTVMVMRSLDRGRLRAETPHSTELFEASDVMSRSGTDWEDFRRELYETIEDPFA